MLKVNIRITINRVAYIMDVDDRWISGWRLYHLSIPPIADDKDLWLKQPGGDRKISKSRDDFVMVFSGMEFYTSPIILNVE